MDFLNREENDIKGIFLRIKERNFSGNQGQAIKNSTYQLTSTIVAKVGSLIFTMIMARILMPELFGYYALALGTIVLFAGISDFGVGSAVVTFISKTLERGDYPKSKTYFSNLIKIKFILVSFSILVLILLSSWIANDYYNKPILFALLAGAIYIPASSFLGFFSGIFQAENKFKYILNKELIFQFMRLALVPLATIIILKKGLEDQNLLAWIMIFISISYLIALLVSFFIYYKKLRFSKEKTGKLNYIEKRELFHFIWPITFTVLSGVFFGYVDTIILGHFVSGSSLGYYSAAFSLVASISTIISFSAAALFPIFSRLKGRRLEKGFKKTRAFTLLISLAAAILTFFLSKYIIILAYGRDYLTANPLLQLFALFILIGPLIALYDVYFTSQEKTKVIAFSLVITTILNIILNYTFISYGLRFGEFEALMGAAIATLISRGTYLVILGFRKSFRRIERD